MADIGMRAVCSECLCRELGCHRLRLKGVVTETSEKWHTKSYTKIILGSSFTHTITSLLDVKKQMR